ncbi:MAG TPA: DUF427 domain-containing protein [Gemmatimonadales bacterium]|nr:DUF427 domain-containing protein [Gemmatimonadales bacterium]
MSDQTDTHAQEREKWRTIVRLRPTDIVRPGPGQESVWDYPRPPRVEPVAAHVRVEFEGRTLADTGRALRVCETSSPPVYYIPQADIDMAYLEPSPRTSFCEWKGVAAYWSVRVGQRYAKDAAWSYPAPDAGFEVLRDWIAFYPRRMDACWVGEQRVTPQPGFYYGGWVTPDLVGPFKGSPGSEGW